MGIFQVVGAALVAERVLAPQAGNHLQLLFDQVHAPPGCREIEAVRLVFGLQPASANPGQLDIP